LVRREKYLPDVIIPPYPKIVNRKSDE